MPLRMWTYDLAREQCPTRDYWAKLCRFSLDSGFNALGIYLEHRFAYPSLDWVRGYGSLEPETIRWMRQEFPSLRLIPFANVLGHMEGFLYAEPGRGLAEERLKGLSGCPSNPEFVKLAEIIVDDLMASFDDDFFHLGGDEASQLGNCPVCAERYTPSEHADLKARLYVDHLLPLIERVKKAGKRPAIWGDMLLSHPEAMESVPKDCLIFNWQYFDSFAETNSGFKQAGFEIVACPTVHTYNSNWINLDQCKANIDDALVQVEEGSADGLCITTWECGLMGNYDTVLPVLSAIVNRDFEATEWQRLMGIELPKLGGPFEPGQIRSGIKCRMLLYGNPFLTWIRHPELCGELGDRALDIAMRAVHFSHDANERGVAVFLQKTIEFVRLAEKCAKAYAEGKPGEAAASLAPARQIFEDLERVAYATHLNAGGSMADVERCRKAILHVETVMRRTRSYGDGSLGYLPNFDILTHPQFTPHDQGSWWLINRWANE